MSSPGHSLSIRLVPWFIALGMVVGGGLWSADSLTKSSPATSAYAPVVGDLIFQSFPRNSLVDAIEGSTGSPFSHCGLVINNHGTLRVLEANQTVSDASIGAFISRGRNGHFAVYRLNATHAHHIPAMCAAAESMRNLPYDIHYDLDDSKIYCSELIWKAYRTASGEELGKLTALGELHWQPYEQVIRTIEQGNLPLDRKIISPAAITTATQCEQVFVNGYP